MSNLITEATHKVASFIDKKIYTKSDSGCAYGANDLNVGNITSTGLTERTILPSQIIISMMKEKLYPQK